MANDNDTLVRDPEELERRRQMMSGAATLHPIVPMLSEEEEARRNSAQPPPIAGAPGGLTRAPEVTGLRSIAPPSGDLAAPTSISTPEAAPKTLPSLSFKERQALPTISAGAPAGSSAFYQNKLERIEDQNRNPWGSAENHPGVLGKIGHVAAKIGNIAGDIVAPGTMALIPGTELNREIEERQTERSLGQAQTRESEGALRSAQQRKEQVQTEEAEKKLSTTDQTLEKDAQGNVTGWHDTKGLHSIDAPETPQEIKDIATASANKILPQYKTNEATGEVLALRFDPNTGKTDAQVVYKGDPKVKTETKDVMRGGKLHAVVFDVTNPLDKNFGKEKADLGETKLPGMSPEEKEGMESVQYKAKDGSLRVGSLADAKANGGKSIRKIGEGEEQKFRDQHNQMERLISNAQSASDTMAAWDNPKDKELAMRVKNAFFSHIPVVGVSPEYVDTILNSDDFRSMTPQGQIHMQNMAQLYSDAINLMKLETGTVPRGEAFLKAEGAIIPSPDKTQLQNRTALAQFDQRIRKDAKQYPRPDDMGPMRGVVPLDATHMLNNKDGQPIGYTDKDGKDVYW